MKLSIKNWDRILDEMSKSEGNALGSFQACIKYEFDAYFEEDTEPCFSNDRNVPLKNHANCNGTLPYYYINLALNLHRERNDET